MEGLRGGKKQEIIADLVHSCALSHRKSAWDAGFAGQAVGVYVSDMIGLRWLDLCIFFFFCPPRSVGECLRLGG